MDSAHEYPPPGPATLQILPGGPGGNYAALAHRRRMPISRVF